MLVIGKGLGGGIFPLAALIAREGLNVMADRALGHFTHEKNPVAAAAGLAAIQCLEEEHLLENAATLGEHALQRMRELAAEHPLIGDVRGLGLLMGMELVRNRRALERASAEAELVMSGALRRGVNFKLTMGNVITLTPALNVTREEMDRALDILDASLVEVGQRPACGPGS